MASALRSSGGGGRGRGGGAGGGGEALRTLAGATVLRGKTGSVGSRQVSGIRVSCMLDFRELGRVICRLNCRSATSKSVLVPKP